MYPYGQMLPACLYITTDQQSRLGTRMASKEDYFVTAEHIVLVDNTPEEMSLARRFLMKHNASDLCEILGL